MEKENMESSDEDMEDERINAEKQQKREEERLKEDREKRIRLQQLEEVPPGLELFKQNDGSVRFKYFTLADLSLVKDFGYARWDWLGVCPHAVLRIRDVYDPGYEFFPSRIQGKKDSGSRIRIRIKEFKYV
jgi:hypothetical protein